MDTTLHTCTGGCDTPVSHPDHPCDQCWDRLPANLKRDLLLSLAGVGTNSAAVAVAYFFRDESTMSRAGSAGLRVTQPH